MMTKSPRNPKEKEKIGFWLLNPASKFESFLLTLFFLLLPTQFGKHFWPDFTIVSGIRIDYLSPILYVTDVILLLLLGSSFFRIAKLLIKSKLNTQKSKIQFKIKKHFLVAGFVILYFICNIFFSSRPLLSMYGFVKLFECAFLSFYFAKTIISKTQLQKISFMFSISALGESLLAIFQYLNQGSMNGIFYFFGERTFTGETPGIANASIAGTLILRPYATFPHPNVLAGFLLIAMVLVWSFLLKTEKKLIKVIAIASLLTSSIALLLTYGRIAILLWSILVGMLFLRMVFQKVKTIKERIIFSAAALLLLWVISLFPVTHDLYSRFSTTSLSEESVTERTELLSASWSIIQNHSLIGVGIYNFIPNLAPLQKPLPLGLYLQPVHNIFVLFLSETGIIGASLFILLLGTTILKIRSCALGVRETFFILLGIICVTGFFDHYWLTLQQGQLLFATVIGLSWAKSSS